MLLVLIVIGMEMSIHTTIGASSLVSLLENFEQYSSGFDTELETGQLLDILKSVGGCVDFGAVKCYVFDIGTHSNTRVLSEKGSPIITDNSKKLLRYVFLRLFSKRA